MLFVVCGLAWAAAFAQTSSTASEKQQVLWQKLESSIADVNRNLDGVMGVAILDLTDGHKYLVHENAVFAQASVDERAYAGELLERRMSRRR